jgi:photosystem II stability/assembly factor-like uncharacterized protein
MKNYILKIILFILIFIQCFGQNVNTILKSQQNYGWKIISGIPVEMNLIYFIDSTNGWVIGDSGKIFATKDGGTTWLPQNSGTENRLESICFIDDSTGFVSGFNRTLIYTYNKGNTWISAQVISDSGSIYRSISSDANNNLYFITNYGEIYSSIDSGKNWFNKFNFSQYFSNVWGFSYINYDNSPICFAKLYRFGVLYKSTDGGDVWKKLNMPPHFTGDFYLLNDDIGWITESWLPSSSIHDSASIYITTDGGETWTMQSTLEGIEINNIVFTDTLEGWASSYTPWHYYINYTSNGGQSWNCQFEFDTDSLGVIKDIFFFNNRNGWTLTSYGNIIKYGLLVEVSVDKPENIHPDEYILNQNYPNPFNPVTYISFSIPTKSFVSLKVFDMLGKEVSVIISESLTAGNYSRQWNAVGLSSGVYFYRLQAGPFIETKKLILLQ